MGSGGQKGELNPSAKFTENDVMEMRRLYAAGYSTVWLSKQYGSNPGVIRQSITGKTWGHVPGRIEIMRPAGPGPAHSGVRQFLESIAVGDGCWNWNTGKDWDGYGKLRHFNRPTRAHRFSFELFNKVKPGNRMVLHHCDNPACVRPDHLYIGDAKRNMQDRDERGRQAVGERAGLAKLTTEQVYKLRKEYEAGIGMTTLGKAYGVSAHCIWSILRARHWKHLGLPAIQRRPLGTRLFSRSDLREFLASGKIPPGPTTKAHQPSM